MSPDATSSNDPDRRIPLPRPWFEDDDRRRLNELFYSAHPDQYFMTRLQLLAIEAAQPKLREQAINEGVEWRGLRFQSPISVDDELHASFVYAEAFNLLHHAGETLLRLYLAHAPDANGRFPDSPWLEIANVRFPGAFKEKLRRRFNASPLTAEQRRAIEAVFYVSKGSLGPASETDVEASIDEIEDWLRYLAQRFWGESEPFNALKHGVSMQATESGFTVSVPDRATPAIDQQGPAVRYLVHESESEGLWDVETLWIAPEYLMGETWFTVLLLSQVLQVGRARYLGEQPAELRILRSGALRELNDARGERGGVLRTLRMSGGQTTAYSRPLTCSVCGRHPGKKARVFETWQADHRSGELVRPVCPECASRG